MTASGISGEPVEQDSDDGIARIIYVVPVAPAVERDERTGEVTSVELRNGA
jgi:hypothetical protein